MFRALIAIVGICAAYLMPPTALALTDDEVRQGIQKLIDKLYAEQNDHGHWDPAQPGNDHVTGVNYGGQTALITYALLTAGESYQNPKLTKALKFLEEVEMKGTYAIGLRAHVWAALPPRFEPLLQKDTNWLLNAIGCGPKGGGYDYTPCGGKGFGSGLESAEGKGRGGRVDNSVTQYGVLGTWEGAKRGMNVPSGYWRAVEDHFVHFQRADGGWDYNGSGSSYGSMTASGLACLFILQDYLHTADFRQPGRTREHDLTAKIQKALDWFGEKYTPTNPGKNGHVHYYLYGVERIGLASGYKTFNNRDWYETGAEFILKNPGDKTNAAFSLLFLVRGRVPVLINKLAVPDYDWNNRPRDIAKLTEWVSDEVEREMNWQIVSITAKPEDWLDAPMLYLASHEALTLTEEQKAKIKRYIDLGGLLVTAADGGARKFSDSVKDLYKELYPNLALEPMPPDDELLDVVFKVRPTRLRVETLHNGVRHLALHLPTDVSWQLHSSSHADPTPWQLLTNAYYYATEKGNMRPRLEDHYVAKRRGRGGGVTMTVARGKYNGNWDPEPGAWEIQTNVMYNDKKVDATVTPVELAQLGGSDAKLAHIVGTETVDFNSDDVAGIKAFVEKGGVVLFEAAGGRAEFTESVMKMIGDAFPGQRLAPLSLSSKLITGGGIGGYDVTQVDYRPYAVLRMGRIKNPRLLAMSFEGRPRVIIASDDLSMAMLDQPVWGVFGYSTESAQKIVANICLFAESSGSGPDTAAE